jgi:NAD+ kinase
MFMAKSAAMPANSHSADMTSFSTIAIIGKYQSPEVAESVVNLAGFLRQRGLKVLIEEETAGVLAAGDFSTANYEQIGASADLAVVLGGDGTMLNSARRLAQFGVPLLGVNQGRLGFMTDIARGNMLEGVASVLDGKFTSEQRFMLNAEVWRDGSRVFAAQVLNDVVTNKGDVGRMIELEVKVDGELIHVLRADGLIVCTPTGSTAYALSANGPILHPSVAGIAIVPLCPHALTHRPITISDQSVVEISLLPSYEAGVHFDGQQRFEARAGDTVRVARTVHSITLLHPPGYSYFAMLREKLSWSAFPRH